MYGSPILRLWYIQYCVLLIVVRLLSNVVHFVQPLGHCFQHLPTRPRTIDPVLQIQYHTMTHPVVVIVTLRVQELLASFTVPRSFAVCGWWSVVQLVVGTFTTPTNFFQIVQPVEVTLPASLRTRLPCRNFVRSGFLLAFT